MPAEIEVQLHLWPWSAGCPERWSFDSAGETVDFKQGNVSFPYYGSPVLSVSSMADIYLPKRYERFVRFGPEFHAGKGTYQLYELPHGVLVSNNCNESTGYLWIRGENKRSTVYLKRQGFSDDCSMGNKSDQNQKLKSALLAWSQQFDILL